MVSNSLELNIRLFHNWSILVHLKFTTSHSLEKIIEVFSLHLSMYVSKTRQKKNADIYTSLLLVWISLFFLWIFPCFFISLTRYVGHAYLYDWNLNFRVYNRTTSYWKLKFNDWSSSLLNSECPTIPRMSSCFLFLWVYIILQAADIIGITFCIVMYFNIP